MTVSPIPAVIAAARRRLIARFRNAGATTPSAAIAIEGMRLIERRQFERMRKAGVIRTGDDGRFWLDEPTAAAYMASIRRRLMMVAAGAVAAGLIAVGLTPKG